jgi:DNA-binding PadR family transcriptional regulator
MELAILGFLAETPLHGYELRRRVAQLSGYARRVSDGTLYPAIKRMTDAGLLDRRMEAGTGAAQRAVLSLTDAGRSELRRRLAAPPEQDVTDPNRWMTLLAFLSLLPDVAEQHAVLRRRLEFLEQPASFFYDDDRPLRAEDMTDPYRRGMFLIARATSRTERTWLHEVLKTPAA